MVNFNVDYDEKNDSLFLFDKKNKSIFTLEFGDFDIDLDEKGGIVGLEFSNASTFFYTLLKNTSNINTITKVKCFLENTTESKVIVNNLRKGTVINLFLASKKENISTNLTVPRLTNKKEIQQILN